MPVAMDSNFFIVALRKTVFEIQPQNTKLFDKYFRPNLSFADSDKITFDIYEGSPGLLRNLSVFEPAQIIDKGNRKAVTVIAPRLAPKTFFAAAEFNRVATIASQFGPRKARETFQQKFERELQSSIMATIEMTLEFWASRALKGKIYDADLSTVLVDYNMPSSHLPTRDWTDTSSNPIEDIREWKALIEKDVKAPVVGYEAICGKKAMNALLKNETVLKLLQYQRGARMAEQGDVERLVGVTIEEYNATFTDNDGNSVPYIPENAFVLIAQLKTNDVFDCPYAPVIDLKAKGGVGSNQPMNDFIFRKVWEEEDPSGVWVKLETRPLPVVRRPAAIVYATVTS